MAFNYNVTPPDIAGGIMRGMQMANSINDRNAKLAQEEQERLRKEQESQLIQQYLGGDTSVLPQLAGMNQQAAANAISINQAVQPEKLEFDAAAIKQGIVQAVDFAKAGQTDLAAQTLQAIGQSVPEQGRGDINRMIQGLQADPQRFVATMQGMIGGIEEKTYKPEISTPQVDADGQQYVIITDPTTQTTRRVDVVGGKVETGDDKMNRDIRKDLLKQATEVSRDAFDQLKTVRSQIGNFDTAIKALEQGAQSGPFQQMLPSIRQSTIELENAAQRLGLDVISATTFGALSEGELRLAMNTAVPMNLEPKALKQWLLDKKAAQKKLGNELYKMATSLGKGKMTVAEYLESNNYNSAPKNRQDDNNTVNWADL